MITSIAIVVLVVLVLRVCIEYCMRVYSSAFDPLNISMQVFFVLTSFQFDLTCGLNFKQLQSNKKSRTSEHVNINNMDSIWLLHGGVMVSVFKR